MFQFLPKGRRQKTKTSSQFEGGQSRGVLLTWKKLSLSLLFRLLPDWVRPTHVTLEKEMATHSYILAWRIPWTEEPGRLLSMGSQESDMT